ncbi:MAG TPA: class I SAM-dependent methyltransferase [Nanoarchaeota archaeon]|nr:class I SAM-dependent methyltransferase [Nanoarchaeota archaeon]
MGIREEHAKSMEYWDGRAKQWSKSSPSVSYLALFYEAWKNKLESPLLDIGCGSGNCLYRAASGGRTDIYGFDISPKLVDIAREKLRPFLVEETDKRIVALDMLDLSLHFSRGFFKSLIFSGVLQQTLYSGARSTLQQIADVSASGAIMYFSTRSISIHPSNAMPVEGEKGTYRLPDGAVKTYYSRDSIEELIEGLFEIVGLDEKPQTEKISGEEILNWEGVLRKI